MNIKFQVKKKLDCVSFQLSYPRYAPIYVLLDKTITGKKFVWIFQKRFVRQGYEWNWEIRSRPFVRANINEQIERYANDTLFSDRLKSWISQQDWDWNFILESECMCDRLESYSFLATLPFSITLHLFAWVTVFLGCWAFQPRDATRRVSCPRESRPCYWILTSIRYVVARRIGGNEGHGRSRAGISRGISQSDSHPVAFSYRYDAHTTTRWRFRRATRQIN